jgi:hypothetical protein
MILAIVFTPFFVIVFVHYPSYYIVSQRIGESSYKAQWYGNPFASQFPNPDAHTQSDDKHDADYHVVNGVQPVIYLVYFIFKLHSLFLSI